MERQQVETLGDVAYCHLKRYTFARRNVSGAVLDAACGVGYGSKLMQDSGAIVTGMDIDSGTVEYANKFFAGPQYVCGDVQDAQNFEHIRACYDHIVSFETLEHLPEPKDALRNFFDILKPRGLLFISTPNEEKYPFRKHVFDRDKYPHLQHYTPEEFEEILESVGFTVVVKATQIDKINAAVVEGIDGKFLIYVACKGVPPKGMEIWAGEA